MPAKKRTPKPATRAPATNPTASPASLSRVVAGGGRATTDTPFLFGAGLQFWMQPPDEEQDWRVGNLDRRTLDHLSPRKALEILVNLSPEASAGLWNFLRLFNPGWEVRAYRPGTQDAEPRAEALIAAFLDRLTDLYGSVDVVVNALGIGAFLRGGFFSELVLDEFGREAVDLATPDPWTVRFRRELDPARGPVWQLGQLQGSGFVPISRPTVRYIPIDRLPGSPYGRPIASPVLYVSLFLLGLMHDLRRVVSQQGYRRTDITVKLQELKDSMPPEAAGNSETFFAWAQAAIDQVISAYGSLEPDDAYIHADTVQVGQAAGAADASGLGGIAQLIDALERQAARAVKQMPLLLGVSEGTSEANANRQWELQAAGFKAIQHPAETMLSRHLEFLCRAQGIQAQVEWEFAELRTAERMRDAQVEALEIDNTFKAYAYGWIDADEAANRTVGHDAVAPFPIILPSGQAGTAGVPRTDQNPDPGSARMREALRRVVEKVEPLGASEDLGEVPSEIEISDDDLKRMLGEWDRLVDAEHVGMLDAEVVSE